MDDQSQNEEINLSAHFYGYLLTIAIAGFGLFMVAMEPNILRQFRFWISPQTFDNLILTWFALSVVTALLIFFIGILLQLFIRDNRLSFYFWYHVILSSSLLFATIFFQLWHGTSTTLVVSWIAILILTNIITFAITAVFFYIHFTIRHNFLPFVLGVLAATTAFNWFYLSLIGKISIF